MIRILGAGAWGTALAALWSHPQEGTPTAEIELIAQSPPPCWRHALSIGPRALN